MTIKIYGPAYSTCVARVLVTLYEKQVEDFENVPLNIFTGEQKREEFLKLQPFGLVPIYDDDELTLFESRAIARIIAFKYEGQGTPLYGTTNMDRALVEQWVEVESQNFNGPIGQLINFLLFAPKMGRPVDEAAASAVFTKFESVLDVYEKQLSKSKYLAGDFFSLADLVHLPSLNYFINGAKKGFVLESRPALKAWWGRISSRPAWKKVLELIAQSMRDHSSGLLKATEFNMP